VIINVPFDTLYTILKLLADFRRNLSLKKGAVKRFAHGFSPKKWEA